MGERLLTAAQAMQGRHDVIGDVRGKGLLVGVELVTDRETKEPAHELRDAVIDEAFKKGLLLLGCGPSAVRFVPAMTVDGDTVDEAMSLFEEALTKAEDSG
jgi:4-aminobutyrate aminotransferase